MWPRATNPENWLPQSQFIKVISTVRIRRTGGSEIHERVAQLFVVVHTASKKKCKKKILPNLGRSYKEVVAQKIPPQLPSNMG